jgi:hypothetical protein
MFGACDSAMREVFSKTKDPKVPLCDQEFYELRLDDSDDIWKPGYFVKQAHAQWSEIDREIMWEGFDFEQCPTLEKAKERYAAWRLVLIEKGFIYSKMDLF